MKASRLFVIAVAGLFAATASVFGQVRIEIQPAQPLQLQPRLQADLPLLTADAVEKLKFTNEQKEKYTKIEVEFKDKYKAAQAKLQADIQGVRDREKFKEAQDKFQTDSKKAREDGLAKVEPILTADQKKVFAQVKGDVPQPKIGGIRQPAGGAGIGQVLPPATQNRLQLTDEQKKQIADIQKEVEAKIMKVLTDEQKKQLEQIKKGPNVRPLPIQPVPPNRRVLPVNPLPPLPAPDVKKD